MHHKETLTGVKWTGNRTVQLTSRGYEVLSTSKEAIRQFILDSSETSLLYVSILSLSVHVVLKSITLHDLWVDMNMAPVCP